MALIRMRAASLAFGGHPLLEQANLQIEAGERVCLLGRNGSGKTTLLQVLEGTRAPDAGEIDRRQGLRTAALPQQIPAELAGTVLDVAAAGLGDLAALLGAWHRASLRVAEHRDEAALAELDRAQHALEAAGGWQLNQRVEAVLSRLELDPDAAFASLSGGLKRKTLLARALVAEPDLLLLDEPTNHLDLDAIAWLEDFLAGLRGALLFVTHDRAFLEALATRIVELDRGRLTSWPGDYPTYLRRKEAELEAETAEAARFDKRLAEEEAWIRQGIKARRTRNEGRVRALEAMRLARAERRERAGSARMKLEEAARSGKLVIEAEGAGFDYGDRTVIKELTTTILRGDKVGLIGPNGAGKTTLLRLLTGDLAPVRGRIRHGTRLQIAYFDQHRAQLEDDATVFDSVAGGSDFVQIGGDRRHVMSYLQDFLFAPQRARSPVASLSGGERNRLLLARLFAQPSNLLVLDEPTNDLDIETLELLETLLIAYSGTLLLVSHDRAFLDNVVTSTLVFEGSGAVREYVGGYQDWLRQRPEAPRESTRSADPCRPPRTRQESRSRKLGYREQRELEALPARIEALEGRQGELHARLADPTVYREDPGAVAELKSELARVESELGAAYGRWETLENGDPQGA